MSEAETQAILSKVKRIKNVTSDGELVQKAVRFMPENERASKQEDLDRTEDVLSPANRLPGHTMLDQDAVKNLVRYRQFLKKDLTENVAPDKLPGDTVDALRARKAWLIEQFQPGMQSHETMRRNPPGAVSEYVKWKEKTQDYVLEFKNVARAIAAIEGDTSEDVANIELYRPTGYVPGDASRFDANAQVTGMFAMSNQAKQNWPLGEPKVDTALAQAERRELEELRAAKALADAKKADLKHRMSVGSKLRWKKAHEKLDRQGDRDLKKLQAERIREALQAETPQPPQLPQTQEE